MAHEFKSDRPGLRDLEIDTDRCRRMMTIFLVILLVGIVVIAVAIIEGSGKTLIIIASAVSIIAAVCTIIFGVLWRAGISNIRVAKQSR